MKSENKFKNCNLWAELIEFFPTLLNNFTLLRLCHYVFLSQSEENVKRMNVVPHLSRSESLA